MTPLMQGLQVSLLGLVITFLALGLFILVIVLLKRLFPALPSPAKSALPQGGDPPHAGDEYQAIAAAAAAAWWAWEETRDTQLGRRLEQPRSAWGQVQFGARDSVFRQRRQR